MNEGAWTILDGDDGSSIAVVCLRDAQGAERLLSECGRRLVRDGAKAFVDAADGRRYVARGNPARDRNRSQDLDYSVRVEADDDLVRVFVSGDHCCSSAIDAQWRAAFAAGAGLPSRKILVVRGPGRVASDVEKIGLLERFLRLAEHPSQIAVVMPECELGRSTLLPAIAAARGVTLRLFGSEPSAERWLAGDAPPRPSRC